MTHLPQRSSRPDAWTQPRMPQHASDRRLRHGPILPFGHDPRRARNRARLAIALWLALGGLALIGLLHLAARWA